MESLTVLTIADLINAGKPVAGSSSLYFSSGCSFSNSFPQSDRRAPRFRPGPAGSDHNPKVLSPLNQPSILIGAISLPSQTLSCPNRHCLQFSDDSRSICCDVTRLEVGAIGERVHVLVWNFIPLEHLGGFLEIIEWKFLDSGISLSQRSMLGPLPLVTGFHSSIVGDSKSKYSAHGVVESVSPVSTVPCLTALRNKDSVNILGFLLRILACKCELCSSKEHKLNLEGFGHSFTEPVFIYFYGCTSSWHTVMTRLVGHIVLLSKMKKKLVFVGKQNSQLMFVTNENSVLQWLRMSKKWLEFSKTGIKGTGKCGAYTGIVKGVYMEGMLVELDLEVWLILTDMIISRPHSLRVGALICIRNVHFVNPKFSWGTMLILGACFKTSITVESFSPWETGGLVVSHSESVLQEFIKFLSFPARFWTLLIISSFQKFGILTEKEHGGLARIYADSHIPLQMFQTRHGVFTEFCFHESSGCNSTAHDCNLKLVVPVSSFVQHNKNILNKLLLAFEKDINIYGGRNHLAHLSSERKICDRFTRKTFLSEDLGIVLLGSLKISRSSGRLQLHDRIGSMDVIVLNLPSRWDFGKIYEVADYCFTVDGPPELMALLKSTLKPFSCRSVFNCSLTTMDSTLQMCISFFLGAMNPENRLLYNSIDCKDDVKELDGGTFHLFFVTHKFPVLQNFQGDRVKSKTSFMYAEAVFLPWDLIYPVGEGTMVPAESQRSRVFPDNPPSKRCRTVNPSTIKWLSAPTNCSRFDSHASICHEISCLVTIPTVDRPRFVMPGILFEAKASRIADTTKGVHAKKVLIEFSSEEFERYNSLQIGGCYMMKHNIEDSFCSTARGRFKNYKILFNPEIRVWDVDLYFCEAQTSARSRDDCPPVFDFSSCAKEGLPNDLTGRGNLSCALGFHSAASLNLPNNVKRLFIACHKDLGQHLIQPAMEVGETSNVNSHNWSAESAIAMHAVPFKSSASHGLFLEGNLVSLSGDVVAIDSFEHFDAVPSRCCVHVLVNHQTMKVFGSLSRHTYLTGFGPGVNATFYRILHSGGESTFALLPVSFIKINSLKVASDPGTERCSDFFATCPSNTTLQENVVGGLVADLLPMCKENNSISFLCKVVSVHIVVLQKGQESPSERTFGFNIPLAGFVVDDGSSVCCCWAEGETASTFLRLHEELPGSAIVEGGWIKKDDNWSTIIYHLQRIVQKHKRVVVRNVGSLVDTSFQDLTISTRLDEVMTEAEERFLKELMLNASNGPTWKVEARKMELNRIRAVEKEKGVEMWMKRHRMENAWAEEVGRMDPLTEARRLLNC